MITGAIKNKVDKIWTDIWAGGLTNPLTVIEQLTYLIFIRSLDEKETEMEQFAVVTQTEPTHIFPQSAIGQSIRWGQFKDKDPQVIFNTVQNYIFPAIKSMKGGKLPDIGEDGKIIENGEQGEYIGNFNGYQREDGIKYSLSEMTRKDNNLVWNAIDGIEPHVLPQAEEGGAA